MRRKWHGVRGSAGDNEQRSSRKSEESESGVEVGGRGTVGAALRGFGKRDCEAMMEAEAKCGCRFGVTIVRGGN